MKLRKVFHRAQASSSHPLRLLTLCAFFAVGIIAGQIMQYMVGVDGSTELATYLRGYAGMITQQEALAPSSALQVVIIYFRGPLLLFCWDFVHLALSLFRLCAHYRVLSCHLLLPVFRQVWDMKAFSCRWRHLDCAELSRYPAH